MTLAIISFITGFVTVKLIQGHTKKAVKSATTGPQPRPEPPFECERCAKKLSPSEVHRLVEVEPDPEFGGGTGMAAEFCAKCCPGGCAQDKRRPVFVR